MGSLPLKRPTAKRVIAWPLNMLLLLRLNIQANIAIAREFEE
jgi:hypothetical protein